MKKFNIENCTKHIKESTSIDPIEIWMEEEYKEEINILGKVGEFYILTQYHKDCLSPDWDNLNTDLINEIFLSKKDIKILQKGFKKI